MRLSFRNVASFATVSLLTACESKEPPKEAPAPTHAPAPSEPAPEPALTPEEQAKKVQEMRENQPEPTLDPKEPRETFALLKNKGKSTLQGIYTERGNILVQMREIKFDDKAELDQAKIKKLADLIESYAIGDTVGEMETAAERFCQLIDELRSTTEPLEAAGQEQLKAIQAEITALEEKQKSGDKVATSQYDKLEKAQKIASAPVLGASYVWLAMKTLYQEAFVLADLGPRRAQLKLRDCIGRLDAKPVPNELAEAERKQALSRAKWYRHGAE
jgi:hypothetical protein